jgi:hypothetical protein
MLRGRTGPAMTSMSGLGSWRAVTEAARAPSCRAITACSDALLRSAIPSASTRVIGADAPKAVPAMARRRASMPGAPTKATLLPFRRGPA